MPAPTHATPPQYCNISGAVQCSAVQVLVCPATALLPPQVDEEYYYRTMPSRATALKGEARVEVYATDELCPSYLSSRAVQMATITVPGYSGHVACEA